MQHSSIEALIGQTLARVDEATSEDKLTFVTESGLIFEMYHQQDCCEEVYLEDTTGDWKDIIGHEILEASCTHNDDNSPELIVDECYLWTFYTIRTNRGTVTLRWLGQSNGYYSIKVDFLQV